MRVRDSEPRDIVPLGLEDLAGPERALGGALRVRAGDHLERVLNRASVSVRVAPLEFSPAPEPVGASEPANNASRT